jgi:D-lactate dehydrogenase
MTVLVYSAKRYDQESLLAANHAAGHSLRFLEARLDASTAALAAGCEAVCIFVNDTADAGVLATLAAGGVRLLALRCAGFNNVDLEAAKRHGLTVVRVPAYSPHAVAEHAVALILTLNRKTHRAFNRVRESNFALDGLLGFDLHGRTCGVVGTGKIGAIFARLMLAFGCRVIAFDPNPEPDLARTGAVYTSLETIWRESDIIALHCPLTPATRYVVNAAAVARLKRGVMLINTSRGALIDTRAAIDGLKSGQIGYLGIDVYEEEADLFFEDHSGRIVGDDVFARLTTFPNVLITAHQGFFTTDALGNIAETTIASLSEFASGGPCAHAVS